MITDKDIKEVEALKDFLDDCQKIADKRGVELVYVLWFVFRNQKK